MPGFVGCLCGERISTMWKTLVGLLLVCILPGCAKVVGVSKDVPALQSVDQKRSHLPEVWLCPGSASVFDLLEQDADWPYSKKHITGLKLYIDDLRRAESSDLKALAKIVRQNGLQITVECGGTLNHDWQDETGERSAETELAKLKRWYQAGGTAQYMDIDGPVRRLLGHAAWGKDPGKKFVSHTRCATELMDYLAAVRKNHPNINFFLLTNFPNWGYKEGRSYHGRGRKRQDWGDYHEVVTTVLQASRQSGIQFTGATVDNPYDYMMGLRHSATLTDPSQIDWLKRVRTYEDYCRSQGLQFNLIINSERGGKASDKLFFDDTLAMLEQYEKAGGRPDRYFVQSWYRYPKAIVPEDQPYSMTALTKAILTRLQEIR